MRKQRTTNNLSYVRYTKKSLFIINYHPLNEYTMGLRNHSAVSSGVYYLHNKLLKNIAFHR